LRAVAARTAMTKKPRKRRGFARKRRCGPAANATGIRRAQKYLVLTFVTAP
jgi:hypothetical protein